MATLKRHLASGQSRLVTVVGVGGVGKTRLVLEAAWAALDEQAGSPFADGVFFVSLADAAIPAELGSIGADLFATAVADALGFALSGSDRPYQQVLRYLGGRRALLVLDNLEHMLHLVPTIVDLLEHTVGLTILATSRARLDVRGEQVLPLGGLPYPPPDDLARPGDTYAALQLFQQTASLHVPTRWSADDIAAAVEVCARVEGVPLAIELAASLVRLLSVREIASELAAGSAVLHTSQRDLPRRHRSLRAVFDHSWHLLPPLEQGVLAQLSVFPGSFDREAARAVAGAELRSLAILIDHSLLRAAAPNGSTHYSMHALVREYAAEALLGDPQGHPGAADRHSRYYLGWVAARLPSIRDERQHTTQAEIHGEIENIRAAWRWAVAQKDLSSLVAAGSTLFYFYEMRSWFQEGVDLFELAANACEPLEASADSAIVRAGAHLLARQGWLTFHLGRPEAARALLARSLALLEPHGAPEERVFSLNYLAATTYHTGGYAEAERLAHAALDVSVRAGDQHGTAIAKTILGQIAFLTGSYTEARRWSLESLALEQTLGNRWGSVFTLISLGRVAVALHAYQDARRWFEEGLAIRQTMGDTRGIGLCLTSLGDVAAALGEYPEAERQYQAGLSHFRHIHNSAGVAMVLTKNATIALAMQDRQRARRLLHEALSVAWAIQSLPATLDALAGLAETLAPDAPPLAFELAGLVARHPASTQNGRTQATSLCERLAAGHGFAPAPDSEPDLAALMPEILAKLGSP